jgi:diguanylate cyclase (GGDEF)-like protein
LNIADGRRRGLVLLNVDGFRQLVARYGDRAVDELLVLISARVARLAREVDARTFRLRRGELAVVLLDREADALREVAAHLLEVIATPTPLRRNGQPVIVTVTVCAGDAGPLTHAAGRRLLVQADDALRRAKAAGPDRIELFTPPVRPRRHPRPDGSDGP